VAASTNLPGFIPSGVLATEWHILRHIRAYRALESGFALLLKLSVTVVAVSSSMVMQPDYFRLTAGTVIYSTSFLSALHSVSILWIIF